MMPLAQRLAEIQPFYVMEIMARAQARAAAGHDVIHLEVGEPDFPTPTPIIEAAQRFLASGHVPYTHACGIAPLREAIANWYALRHGVSVDPARIIVTAGSSAALLLALGLLTNPADEWLLNDPGYPCNRHLVRFCEGRPRLLATTATTNFHFTAEQIRAAWTKQTKGVLIASPANPTGTLIDEQTLFAIKQVIEERGGHLIVDEIYHGLTYGCEARSALALSDDIIVINSFSKYFGMTGWRLGWLVLPPRLVRAAEKLAQNLYICPSTVAQHAALAAFTPETLAILESRRQAFAARRDLLLPKLQRLGFTIDAVPMGAFYIYAGIENLASDGWQFSLALLNEANVAVTPGLDFGMKAAARYIRFAYTVTEQRLAEGVRRIEHFLTNGGAH
ncbi:MAG: pyridoxal phosphate-dependent aminotransferase [Rhodocyclaceae bacterium]|nr:pyridoxal phosphate-dependent aminotransferase [Rhodocyclaceae bacterium]